MGDAVRRGDGRKIDGYGIIVDREFGRTKKGWYPRRLGGGKGEARRSRSDEIVLRQIQRELDTEEDRKIKEPATGTMSESVETPAKVTPLKTEISGVQLEEGQIENGDDDHYKDSKRYQRDRRRRSRSRSYSPKSRSPPRDYR